MPAGNRTEDTDGAHEHTSIAHPPEDENDKHYWRNWGSFWLIGLVNNLVYCVVLAAAVDIVKALHIPRSYAPVLPFSTVAFGTIVKVAAVLCLGLPVFVRAGMAYSYTIIGILLVSLPAFLGMIPGAVVPTPAAPSVALFDDLTATPSCPPPQPPQWSAFVLVVLGVLMIGNGSAYGETTSLAHMERFPPRLIGAWASGTGLSGVLGALLYLLLHTAAGFDYSTTFLSLSVWIAMSAFAFVRGLVPNQSQPAVVSTATPTPISNLTSDIESPLASPPTKPADTRAKSPPRNTYDPTAPLLQSTGSDDATARALEVATEAPSDFWYVHSQVLWNCFNLSAVYLFEYACQTIAPFAVPCGDPFGPAATGANVYMIRNFNVLAQFAYQFGVLISRSSLGIVRISNIFSLTVIQGINAVGWVALGAYSFIDPLTSYGPSLMLLWMFGVGLVGGASYVNVFYNMKTDNAVAQRDRETAVTIGSIYVNVGIVLGTFSSVVFGQIFTCPPDPCV